jgi:hypothetical protein
MKHQEYTKEEQEFIEKWGRPSDLNYDRHLVFYSMNGKRVSALDLAKTREKSVRRKDDPELSKYIYDMST